MSEDDFIENGEFLKGMTDVPLAATTNELTEWYKEATRHMLNSDYARVVYTISRVSGCLSIFGSVYILQDILKRKRMRNTVSSRIILLLSLSDLLYSFFGAFLGPWVAPAGEAYGSVGNTTSCTISGVFAGYGFYTSTLYNASLALCYLLMVQSRHSERKLRSRKMQLLFLGLPILIVLPLCALSLYWKASNFGGASCIFPVRYIVGCDNQTILCERGKIIGTIMSKPGGHIVFAWNTILCTPIVVVCMFLLYWSVYKQDTANAKHRFSGVIPTTTTGAGGPPAETPNTNSDNDNQNATTNNSTGGGSFTRGNNGNTTTDNSTSRVSFTRSHKNDNNRRNALNTRTSAGSFYSRSKSNRVAMQGICYVWAFLIPEVTFIVLLLFQEYGKSSINSQQYQRFYMFASFVQPAQGFFNFLVYIRPRVYEYYRQRQKRKNHRNKQQQQRVDHHSRGQHNHRSAPLSCYEDPSARNETNETTSNSIISTANAAATTTTTDPTTGTNNLELESNHFDSEFCSSSSDAIVETKTNDDNEENGTAVGVNDTTNAAAAADTHAAAAAAADTDTTLSTYDTSSTVTAAAADNSISITHDDEDEKPA